jgi:imidazolonepropionase-like amidohydrolase
MPLDRRMGDAGQGSASWSRRRFLAASAFAVAAAVVPRHRGGAQADPSVQPGVDESAAARRTLYRSAAMADGRSARLRVGVSVLVVDGLIAWIRPSDDEGDTGPRRDLDVVDASGATIVPGMVDAHAHLTMPGGARWIERGLDPPRRQLAVAEDNGRLLTAAGVRWVRDVGSPRGQDPDTGEQRALSLVVRDRWATRSDVPYVRAAGTWLTRRGSLAAGLAIEVDDADELLRAVRGQLDDGADLVKLYLDGPDPAIAPWSRAEVRRVVRAVHSRGARVTAHAGHLDGARTAVRGGVDAIEHGFELDDDLAREMARRDVFLVSTLSVMRSWLTFRRTTDMSRFNSATSVRRIRDRLEAAEASVRAARAAGVRVAAGTDFGGGSLRAGQLAWEVESLVRAGMEPWEALGAATWRGGQLLGEADAGSIREGGPADFMLVHGDPLSDPSTLWRVWHVAWMT